MRSIVYLYMQASVTMLKGKLVGLNGLEPSTSRLSGGRSNLLSYKPIFPRLFRGSCPVSLGGDNRDRTDDPLLAKQVLSQLSYTPVAFLFSKVHYEPQKLNNECNLGLMASS